MKKKTLAWAIIVLATSATGCQSIPPNTQEPIYIGVLEDLKTEQKARVLFVFENGTWQPIMKIESVDELKEAINAYPRALSWSVFYEGKRSGEINSSSPDEWKNYGELGLQLVQNSIEPNLQIGRGADRFAMWLGEPRYRPLILASGVPGKSVPGWVTLKPSARVQAQIIKNFKVRIPTIPMCDNPESNKIVNKTYKYKDKDLQSLESYKLPDGSIIAGIKLNHELYWCDGPPGGEWSEHWFLQGVSGYTKFLGSSLRPVDSLQLDGQTSPVWLFSKTGYNEDGYIMYFDNFQGSTSITWKYH